MALTKVDDRGLTTPIDLQDDEKIRLGTGNDLEIYGVASDGTAAIINHANGDLLIKHGSDKQLISRDDGSVELYYDDSKKLETISTGATVTGSLGIGTTSPARLLHQHLSSSAANYHLFTNDTTGSNATDGLLLGINSSEEAIIWNYENTDMRIATNNSDRLIIKANGNIEIPADDKKLQIGASQDFEIYHDGTYNIIKSANNHNIELKIGSNTVIKAGGGGEAQLLYNGSKKLETTTNGITASGTQHIFTSGTSGDCELIIQADSDNSNEEDNPRIVFKQDGSGTSNSIGVNHPNNADQNDLYIANGNLNGDIGFWTGFDSNNQNNYAAATQRLNITTDGHVQIPADNKKLEMGAGQDFEIYFNGSQAVVNSGANNLLLLSNITQIATPAGSKYFKGQSGVAELYYSDSSKLATSSTGVTVTGNLGINVASPDSPLEVGGTGPSLATIHHTDGGTNDEARLMLGALSSNPPDQRGAGISAKNKGAGHDLEIQTSSTHSAGPSTKMIVTAGGDTLPAADSAHNLGANAIRWANVYADTYYGDGSNLTGMFVTGMIMLWSGASNAIPTGWVLCNGSNSTPDLRDRFVVGAGGNYSVGATGGADTVTLSINEIPSHNHNLLYNSGSFGGSSGAVTPRGTNTPTTPGLTDRISSTGGGAAHENRPPYYALCYIMKT